VYYDAFVTQTAQAYQQVVEKQVSATLAHLTETGNSPCITPSLSLTLLSYFRFEYVKTPHILDVLLDLFCCS